MGMTEEAAARYVRAALRLMIERIPEDFPVRNVVRAALVDLDQWHPHPDGDPPMADIPWGPEPITEPAPRPWSMIAEGDWVRGGDGAYYLVQGNRAENGKAYVTLHVRGKSGTYAREPGVDVLVKRGATGLAVDMLAEAFDLAVLRSE